MSDLAIFLQDLLAAGHMHLPCAPLPHPADDAVPILMQAYHTHRLTVAGPPIPFDPAVALAAASLVQHAAWYLLNPTAVIAEQALQMPLASQTPAHHLSADLVLRYLPHLTRRARALSSGDVLPQALAGVLRRWPLSGVLADIAEPPLTSLDLGHAGLQLLYAERLVQHERPSWFPTGPGAAQVELVWQELGRDISRLPQLQAVAEALTAAAKESA